MEPEVEPIDPIKDAVALINQGIFNLENTPHVGGLIAPIHVKTYKERAARDIVRGTEILEPCLVNALEKSTFSHDTCLKALKFFGEMYKLAQDLSDQNQFSIPEINRPDLIFLTLSVKKFLTSQTPKKNTEEKLIELKEKSFQFLQTINSSPEKSKPRCLVDETLRATTHIMQTPEAMDDYIPRDPFSLKGLLTAARKTGFSFWHHRQQKRVGEKTSEELLKEHQKKDSSREEKGLIDFSLKSTEEKVEWLHDKSEEYQRLVSSYLSPQIDGERDERLQQKNLKMLEDGLKFAINPASVSCFAGPKTLAAIQWLPRAILNRAPESVLPVETIEALKRDGEGFKPSDISRTSDKVFEELSRFLGGDTPEARIEWKERTRKDLQEKICPHITPENADLLSSTTKKATSLLSKAREHLHRFTTHATFVERQEKEALSLFKQLVEEDKKWRAQQNAHEEVD
ncbi:TPA: hypothetical protein DIC20_04675 [Candidatus Dependentiae bacterium]|nr:hypothetical protein [Candidatus Dependentiae bacterium]HCU00969.1 hypothetical protein [Candidatus Dependentiae bacterium]